MYAMHLFEYCDNVFLDSYMYLKYIPFLPSSMINRIGKKFSCNHECYFFSMPKWQCQIQNHFIFKNPLVIPLASTFMDLTLSIGLCALTKCNPFSKLKNRRNTPKNLSKIAAPRFLENIFMKAYKL